MTVGETLPLPADALLEALLRAARRAAPADVLVHDVLGFDKTYPQLLGDVRRMRLALLLAGLEPSSATASATGPGADATTMRCVGVLTRSAYEVMVAFFACRAVAAVCMPLASGLLPEEAHYILASAGARCLLVGRERAESGEAIRAYIDERGQDDAEHRPLTLLPISTDASPLPADCVHVDETARVDPGGPGFITFTSGSSGRPKGVVLPRRCFADAALAAPGSVTLSHRPAHWISGLRNIILPAVSGIQVVAVGENPSPADLLQALAQYRVTDAAFSPVILRRIKEFLTPAGRELSEQDRATWAPRFRALGAIRSSAGALEPSAVRFWADLTGLPFENMYGLSECGIPPIRGVQKTQGSMGTAVPGVSIKLSEGTTGEIRVKSPNLFLRYLGSEELTRAAFDEDGYYKTGDLGELKDGEYLFRGRAISDFIICGTLHIPVVMVENSLMDLPYIAESCVIGVPEYTATQLCGAVVRPAEVASGQITLARVRSDLAASLPLYMLPTVLRVLDKGEQLPRTITGKLVKKNVLRDYFGNQDGLPTIGISPQVKVEQCPRPQPFQDGYKPWDCGGLQRAL